MPAPLRILVVEDSAVDAEVTMLEFSRSGLAVDWRRVETAREFRAALADGPWDVVLSDFTMPAFEAADALALCREADPALPFVVVSGTIGERQAVEMMRAGAADYLLKGSLNRLASVVEREVRETAGRRARLRAEEALRESETRYRRLFEAARDGILIVDPGSRQILDVNPFLVDLLGYRREELLGKELWQIGLFRDIETSKASFRTLQDVGHVRYDNLPLSTKDGRRIEVEFVSNVYDAGDSPVIQCNIRDITQRTRAAEALASSEARLRLFIEHVSVPIAMLDREMRYLHVSRRWQTDYQLGDRDVTGLSHYEVFPELPPSWKEIHRRCLAGAVDTCDEVRFERADGTVQWIRWEVRPWMLAGGEIGGIVMFTEDITARKTSGEVVRRSEERYRTLVAATSAIVWTSPASGEFDSDQPEWTAFTGQTLDQHRGWGWLEVVHPDDRGNSARAWAAAVAGRTIYQVEHRLRRADGEYREMSVRAVPVLDPGGAIREWIGVHTDVTDQRRAESDLRMRDRAIRAATQGLLITDPDRPDNPIVYASPGFERMTGYSAGEALGRNPRFLQGKDTDAAMAARLGEAVRAGEPCTVELLNYRKDGTTFWNEMSISPVREADGRLTHFVGVQSDVTDRRGLEEQYRQAQKMEAVGQLAGGIAHDFNNMLCVINGYSDLLLQDTPADHPNFPFLNEIRSAGEQSASLTRQLLVFSRKQVVAPTVLDLDAVVTDAEKLLRRVIGENVAMVSSLCGGPGRVRADAGQLRQLLMNLAINARDAMLEGGKLAISTSNVQLDVAYGMAHPGVRPGPHVLLTVSDTGRGMTPEVRGRIFEPFFTTKGIGKGTGLGLAVVHGIVTQAGGSIEVSSEVGVGTTFRVYLPRVDQHAKPPKPLSSTLPPPRGTETVLVVEDEDGVRALTRHVLAGCGYKVLEAANGEHAQRVAGRHDGPVHLLVTDVVMPGMGGKLVAERLLALHPEMKVLFVSGYADDPVVRHGVLEKQTHFLQKPFSLRALARKVREVLDAPPARGG